MYLGFDRLAYPGDEVMAALRATGRVSFTGAYLAPAPSHPSTTWMPHIAGLIADGWGVLPIYVGQQGPGDPGSHVLTAAQGNTDADDAITLAVVAGLVENSVVYLEVAAGGVLAAAHREYIGAWVEAMRAGRYRPGIYCAARQTAAQLAADVGRLPVWVFRATGGPLTIVDVETIEAPDPIGSGYQQALVWQYRPSLSSRVGLSWTDASGQTCTLTDVDFHSSVVPDPSNPVLPCPVITEVIPSSGTAGDTIRITGYDLGTVSGAAFGSLSAADLAIVDSSTVDAVVPDGLSGQTVRIVLTNRWGLSAETAETFGVDVSPAGPLCR